MADLNRFVVELEKAHKYDIRQVGGKAKNLGKLSQFGYSIPRGFCLLSSAYDSFVQHNELSKVISMELGKKSLKTMRWEEIWDSALRIRSFFLNNPFPNVLKTEIQELIHSIGKTTSLAIRSSSISEDSSQNSFAGLHESVTDIVGLDATLKAIKVVWASLWSDAALLYRKELGLSIMKSKMAIVIQSMHLAPVSGVAFGQDPRGLNKNHEIIEAVSGKCSKLVNAEVDPDTWVVDRNKGIVLKWKAGFRQTISEKSPLLSNKEVASLHGHIRKLAKYFNYEPDIEWTGSSSKLTLLQIRPITALKKNKSDKRQWYLTLRLKPKKLRELCKKVNEEIIPAMKNDGESLATEKILGNSRQNILKNLNNRFKLLVKWRKVYKKDLIPFADGARSFGIFYNELIQPSDPYEFVSLLQSKDLLSFKRNQTLVVAAKFLIRHKALHDFISNSVKGVDKLSSTAFTKFLDEIADKPGGSTFKNKLKKLLATEFDVAFEGRRVNDEPYILLTKILELAIWMNGKQIRNKKTKKPNLIELENKYIKKALSNKDLAAELLGIGRLSWQLRDDDNILLGRIESQFLRVLDIADRFLRKSKQLYGKRLSEEHFKKAIELLKDESKLYKIPIEQIMEKKGVKINSIPRQLLGQPASPGLASGVACCVNDIKDFNRFKPGFVLVCDSIQPQMTHLVPLASAIVESRGGMLIHGAIIARELGIPCVNGIKDASELLQDGVKVTVDGHLGIVTVGEPEFDKELI